MYVINSTKYSYLFLRLGLAAVFLWFGIDKFFHPSYWLNAWVPAWMLMLVGNLGISATQFIYLNGVLELLIALSMITGVFIQFFSFIASLFLVATMIISGFSEAIIRDFAMIGAFVSVFLWPDRQR